MKSPYVFEEGQLVIYVFRGMNVVGAAFALTYGGWEVCVPTGAGYLRVGGDESWSRADAIRFLETRFPGLSEAV